MATDVSAACRDLTLAKRGSLHVTESPAGWQRHLMMFREIEMLPALSGVLRQAGTGRLALDEDYDEFGSLWAVLAATDGEVRTVHRHYILNADPNVPEEVGVALEDLGADPRGQDVAGADAAAAAAALFEAASEPMIEAEAATDSVFDQFGVIGPLPWWEALGLPWPGDVPELDQPV